MLKYQLSICQRHAATMGLGPKPVPSQTKNKAWPWPATCYLLYLWTVVQFFVAILAHGTFAGIAMACAPGGTKPAYCTVDKLSWVWIWSHPRNPKGTQNNIAHMPQWVWQSFTVCRDSGSKSKNSSGGMLYGSWQRNEGRNMPKS